jgi:hypothetical protein
MPRHRLTSLVLVIALLLALSTAFSSTAAQAADRQPVCPGPE